MNSDTDNTERRVWGESGQVCLCVRGEGLKAGSNSTHPESDNGMQQGQGESECRDSVFVLHEFKWVCRGGCKGTTDHVAFRPIWPCLSIAGFTTAAMHTQVAVKVGGWRLRMWLWLLLTTFAILLNQVKKKSHRPTSAAILNKRSNPRRGNVRVEERGRFTVAL